MLSPAIIERLKNIAKRQTWEDGLAEDEYLNPQDFSGGNFDDAYAGGTRTGETDVARMVLRELGIDYTA